MKNFFRIYAIHRTLHQHGLDEFLTHTPLNRYRWFLKLTSLTSAVDTSKPRGQRLREALTELGPIFIKFGQMLSTRRDLLPDDIAQELAQLQDKVPPFDNQLAKQRIESQLGLSTDQVFEEFEQEPLASASIAQVHGAVLKSGEHVVVKVIRPGIRKQITQDLGLLHQFAHWVEQYATDGKRFRAKQVVADYQESIYNELDLRTEAANTMQLRRNFNESELLYVPEVFWDFTREKVMVQERISGIPIANIEELHQAQVNMQELAHRGVEIFFTQVFKDSFFHADMHPGNIFVDVSDPQKPRYIGIDCGIMGTLGQQDKRYLAENFLAFFERDYRRIAELHVQSGWVNPDTPIDAFESAIRTACEPIFGKPIAEISFGQFLIQLFQVARRFQMEVQPQLVLLQKTLLYIEGLGRQLYPQLDLWATAQPFLRRWVNDQMGPQAVLRRIVQKWPVWVEQFPDMPERLAGFLEQNTQQNSELLMKKLTEFNHGQYQRRRSSVFSVIGATALLSTALLLPHDLTTYSWVTLATAVTAFALALKN